MIKSTQRLCFFVSFCVLSVLFMKTLMLLKPGFHMTVTIVVMLPALRLLSALSSIIPASQEILMEMFSYCASGTCLISLGQWVCA